MARKMSNHADLRKGFIRAARNGQTAVEFAMTVLVYLTVVFAIIEFGRVLYAYNLVAYSARQGSRYAAVHGSSSKSPASSSAITSVVQNEINGLDTSNNELSVTTSWSPNNRPGGIVTVKVQYTLSHVVPLWNWVLALSSTSKMTISQ